MEKEDGGKTIRMWTDGLRYVAGGWGWGGWGGMEELEDR